MNTPHQMIRMIEEKEKRELDLKVRYSEMELSNQVLRNRIRMLERKLDSAVDALYRARAGAQSNAVNLSQALKLLD